MNKKIFNFKLYIEGLKQLKVFGLICTVSMTMLSVIYPLFLYFNAENYYSSAGRKEYMTPINMTGFYILFFLFAFIFTIYLFRFMTSKNASDYYFSLPHTRTCLALSFMGSIATWLLISIGCAGAASAIANTTITKYILVYHYELYLSYSLNIFLACIIISAVTLIALSLTGTILSAILTTGIIYIVPIIVIQSIINIIEFCCDITFDFTLPVLNPHYNLITAIIVNCLNNGSYDYATHISVSTAYSAILLILLLTIGLFLFKKRNAETAGNASVSNKAGFLVTIALGTVLSMLPIGLIFDYAKYKYSSYYNGQYIFELIVIYIAITFALFIFNLVTAKSVKAGLKGLLSVPVVAVINVIILTIIYISSNVIKEKEYSPDTVSSVKIDLSLSDLRKANGTYYRSEYHDSKAEDIVYTDEEMIELLCNAYTSYPDDKTEPYTYVYVKFNNGPFSYYRTVYINYSDHYKLMQIINSNDEIYKIYSSLPDPSAILYLTTQYYEITDVILSKNDINEIITNLKNDMKDMSLADIQAIYDSTYDYIQGINDYPYDYLVHLSGPIRVSEDYNDLFSIYLTDKTPNALSAYLNIMAEKQSITPEKFLDLLNEDYSKETLMKTDFYYYVYDLSPASIVSYFDIDYELDNNYISRNIYELLLSTPLKSVKDINISENYIVKVYLNTYGYDTETKSDIYINKLAYFALPKSWLNNVE